MEKVVFVILHYLTIGDTLECVESIKKNINYNNYEIIIVDNASTNGTGEILRKKFKDEDTIHILDNKENLGFAKGNNIGYVYAKNELNADFIILINNDTYILDNNFIKNIVSYYNENKFHLMGPKIISVKDKNNQNPLDSVITEKREIVKHIVKYSILYTLNLTQVERIIKCIKSIKKLPKDMPKNRDKKESILVNVPLHGSCLICSPLFIDNMKYAFYPNTFLFVEEDILYNICMKKHFTTIYYPNITIFHKEDSSTDFLMQNNEKKRRFIYKNIIKSSIEYYKLIINFEEKYRNGE